MFDRTLTRILNLVMVLTAILFMILVVTILIKSSLSHDQEVMKSANSFTSCVETNHHMTPSQFIEKYGTTAECN